MRWLAECHNAIQWGNNLRIDLFKVKNLKHLVLLATMATLVVGLILFLIDPNIKSPLDGIWSAWVTMTHVGFGDVVPVSFFGRLLAAGLILFGLVFFSLFTALISVALIGRNMHVLGMDVQQIEQETGRIQTGESRILEELARLHERMAALEKQLSSNTDQDRSVN
ncbi:MULTISPECIES: potassium channel family protein [Methylobacter]|uniref:Ion transport 2 domain protein n=1 Tax=Methylobacter tundripaludum (strain ATCC BAA-1195 / DSM 17260 / SV96) TaxID=697282 RepID=G3IQP9_METTV|nr:potassium channel family protein [Methylobacter tundripaludum]EGW23249.1 Ion transport 2 domain protein [Methylobacter tundripaludum SV96]